MTVSSAAFAQEESSNTSTLKASDVQNKDEQKKDIDEEITNARMRATLGSKSMWSFKSALGYSGGSVSDPLSAVRPNYRAGANRETVPALSGTVGVNYRMTDRDNLSLTTGITVVDPLHGDITKSAVDKRKGRNDAALPRYEVSTPSVSWSRGYRAMGAQMITDASLSYYTDVDSNDINALGDVSISQTVLADFGTSKWQGGLSFAASKTVYGGDIREKSLLPDYESGVYKRSDMLLAVYPFAEYAFNDKYSFRTVFGYFEFLNYKDEYVSNTNFIQREPYQSVGVGISITRDIYLYPNVQFAPKDIRSDRTNVALSTNINLF